MKANVYAFEEYDYLPLLDNGLSNYSKSFRVAFQGILCEALPRSLVFFGECR